MFHYQLLVIITIVSLNCFIVSKALQKSDVISLPVNETSELMLSPRIVGGFKAKLGSFPYQVSVQRKNETRVNLCGGCIISLKCSLSSAHCFSDEPDLKDFYVVVGMVSLTSDDAVFHNVDKIIIHSGYAEDFRKDIAMIVIEDRFKFNNYVKQILLAASEPKPLTEFSVTGWGASDEKGIVLPDDLLVVFMLLRPANDCLVEYNNSFDNRTQICAGGGYGKDICFGDSGGPLASDGELYGIAMGSSWICGKGAPSVFTNVNYFRSWIRDLSSKNHTIIINANEVIILFKIVTLFITTVLSGLDLKQLL